LKSGPIIEYNDFEFEAGDDGGDDLRGVGTLQSRLEEVREEERQKHAVVRQNWRRGNWNVRGFSLDRYGTTTTKDETTRKDDNIRKEGDSPEEILLDISQLSLVTNTNLENDDHDGSIVVVGRTDGSVCIVKVGTQYWTRFDSDVTAKETSEDNTVRIESQLVRDTSGDNKNDDKNDIPFEMLHQFITPEQQSITALLAIDDDDDNLKVITGDTMGNIRIWDILYDEQEEDSTMIRGTPVNNLDASPIVALKSWSSSSWKGKDNNKQQEETNLLISISCKGTVALWDLSTGVMLYKCRVNSRSVCGEQNNPGEATDDVVMIHCADVFDGYLFLGLSSGHVLTYKIEEMMDASSDSKKDDDDDDDNDNDDETPCAIPNGNFLADSSSTGITAIASGGIGRLDRSSMILVTGSADGKVRQWELLPRQCLSKEDNNENNNNNNDNKTTTTKTRIEHWPRLANQRMSKRAHVFRGHDDKTSITALAYRDTTHFVSAGTDGTVRAWNTATGNEMFVFDGFSSSVQSLCVTRDTLLTNGMKQFVCLHDFDVDSNNVDQGFQLEW